MVDRQDIDALLIGALYGELTPADETRLASHLESHPADRSVLDGLKAARQAVRDSRILDVQVEPPQQISALLLQEAHRRAPRRADKESWLARFMRSFMVHPAMAAAAMLVVVLGVAGTLYVRGGAEDQLAEKTVATSQTPPELAATPVVTSDAAMAHATGSAFEADIVNDETRAKLSETQAPAAKAPAPKTTASVTKLEPAKPTAVKHAAPSKQKTAGIEVTTKDFAPKELPDGQGAGDMYAPATGSLGKGEAAPAPPPPPAQAAPMPAIQPPSRPADTSKFAAGKPGAAKSDAPAQPAGDPVRAWAVSQHNTARSYAANGNCSAVARIAVAVQDRAPGYFATEMADDRALKSCKVYIDAARAQDAEKNAKSRAQKRVNANEAAPAPSMDSNR